MLHIKQLHKSYGETVAVHNLSFSIAKGEVLGLLGHNGAGKSTTVKMILGILTHDDGVMEWEGQLLKHAKIKMGYLPEERGLYEKSKVYDQLMYFGKLEGMKKKEINESMDYWLNRLEIPQYKYKYVHELSKGNKQKIQLIVAILHDPELIILDEPFSGLDPVNANVFADIIKELIDKKKTMIMSSHRMEQLETFCQNILIMKKGENVLSGSLDEIKKQHGVKRVEVKCVEDISSWLNDNQYTYKNQQDLYTITIENDLQTQVLFQQLKENGFHVRHFVMREPSLHEIFVEVVTS